MTPTPPAGRFRFVLILLVVLGVAAGGWYAVARGKPLFGSKPARASEAKPVGPATVEVVAPQPGGIGRVCIQPGTVEAFESADLYAKVSGFLVEQNVDIGSKVKAGDVLAKLSVPEYAKQTERDAAGVRQAEAKVAQMTAAITTAEAELRAATATVALTEAEVKSKTSYRSYRQKQHERIRELVAQNAEAAKLAEEEEDHYQAAVSAELAAGEAVNAAKQKEAAAKAKIEQAKADRTHAESEVAVAKAQLEKSQVLQDYTVIRSPYTGVITRRSFHLGEFVKSADAGGSVPVLSVERTDVMRVVVQVPDRDVPYVTKGAPAVIEIDALPDRVFETGGQSKVEVARWADAEDPATRTMRTEVDVPNRNGKLRTGMYGRVKLKLSPGTPNALRVPSPALFGKAEDGHGSVRVLRGDKVHVVPVQYATDNGIDVEIVAGLKPDDRVITRASGSIEEGDTVTVADSHH